MKPEKPLVTIVLAAVCLIAAAVPFSYGADPLAALKDKPDDKALLAKLKNTIPGVTNAEERCRLGVIYCLGTLAYGDTSEGCTLRTKMAKAYPSNPLIKALSDQNISAACQSCTGGKTQSVCSKCSGNKECSLCGGTGRSRGLANVGVSGPCSGCQGKRVCSSCSGSGNASKICKACGGSGQALSQVKCREAYVVLLQSDEVEAAPRQLQEKFVRDSTVTSVAAKVPTRSTKSELDSALMKADGRRLAENERNTKGVEQQTSKPQTNRQVDFEPAGTIATTPEWLTHLSKLDYNEFKRLSPAPIRLRYDAKNRYGKIAYLRGLDKWCIYYTDKSGDYPVNTLTYLSGIFPDNTFTAARDEKVFARWAGNSVWAPLWVSSDGATAFATYSRYFEAYKTNGTLTDDSNNLFNIPLATDPKRQQFVLRGSTPDCITPWKALDRNVYSAASFAFSPLSSCLAWTDGTNVVVNNGKKSFQIQLPANVILDVVKQKINLLLFCDSGRNICFSFRRQDRLYVYCAGQTHLLNETPDANLTHLAISEYGVSFVAVITQGGKTQYVTTNCKSSWFVPVRPDGWDCCISPKGTQFAWIVPDSSGNNVVYVNGKAVGIASDVFQRGILSVGDRTGDIAYIGQSGSLVVGEKKYPVKDKRLVVGATHFLDDHFVTEIHWPGPLGSRPSRDAGKESSPGFLIDGDAWLTESGCADGRAHKTSSLDIIPDALCPPGQNKRLCFVVSRTHPENPEFDGVTVGVIDFTQGLPQLHVLHEGAGTVYSPVRAGNTLSFVSYDTLGLDGAGLINFRLPLAGERFHDWFHGFDFVLPKGCSLEMTRLNWIQIVFGDWPGSCGSNIDDREALINREPELFLLIQSCDKNDKVFGTPVKPSQVSVEAFSAEGFLAIELEDKTVVAMMRSPNKNKNSQAAAVGLLRSLRSIKGAITKSSGT